MADERESGWLIERPGPLFYGRCGWGGPGDAIRFVRKLDADNCIEAFRSLGLIRDTAGVIATDHLWVPRPPTCTACGDTKLVGPTDPRMGGQVPCPACT